MEAGSDLRALRVDRRCQCEVSAACRVFTQSLACAWAIVGFALRSAEDAPVATGLHVECETYPTSSASRTKQCRYVDTWREGPFGSLF